MSSMPQQAVAKGMGQMADLRDQLMSLLICVVSTLSVGSSVSTPMCFPGSRVWGVKSWDYRQGWVVVSMSVFGSLLDTPPKHRGRCISGLWGVGVDGFVCLDFICV